MAMTVEDANWMIQKNIDSVKSLEELYEQTGLDFLPRTIASRWELIREQQESSRFGNVMYFTGAKTATSEQIAEEIAKKFYQMATVKILDNFGKSKLYQRYLDRLYGGGK